MLKKLTACVALLCVPLILTGCVAIIGAAAGGAGTAMWLSGKLIDEVNAPYDKTIAAAKKGLAALDMPILKQTEEAQITQLISTYKDGSKTWIDIRPLTTKSSKIEIRVGMRGSKTASTEIMDKIKSYL